MSKYRSKGLLQDYKAPLPKKEQPFLSQAKEKKIFEFEKPLNKKKAEEILKSNNMNPNLEVSGNFSFWNPDNQLYKTQSMPIK